METNNRIPTSHTKVLLPKRRPEILTRPRLLDKMFGFFDKKLVLVSAPAGYGKTSLLIDLSQNSDLPFCWLALDELDQDPQRFAAYFIESIAHRFPEFGAQARSVLNNLTSLDQGMEQLVVTLVNDIYDHIPQHFVMILDDYHLIGEIPNIQRFLSRFIQLVDENFHLVVSSRVLVNLIDIPLMVARDQVGGLDLTELSFRADEIQALFAQNYGTFISDTRAKELKEDTEGWITGLQLSHLGLEDGMEEKFQVARATGVDLFDYLSQQVLDQQAEDIQFFLLRSSLLEEFDAEFCEIVLGELYPARKDWQRWIHIIVQKNLFTLPVGLDSGWVRYHHLFRDFLQECFKKQHPDEIEPILRKLAQVYEIRKDWERAYHILKQLHDLDTLASLIERSAPQLFQKALVTLESWLKDLPPSVLSTRPGLLSVRGNVESMKGNLKESLALLNQAEQIFRSSGDPNGLATTLNRRATTHRFLGDYLAALRDANEVISIAEHTDEMQLLHADALRQTGLSFYRQGQSRKSAKVLARALEIYVRLEDSSHIPVLMMETGMAYDAIGKAERTKQLYDDALQIWRKEGNLNLQANLLNNLGVFYFNQGNYEKSLLALEEGLLCAKRSGYNLRMEALLLISLGDVYAEVEDNELAQQCYQQGNQIAREIGNQFLLNYLDLAQVQLSIQQQNLDVARQLLDGAKKNISSSASQYEEGLFELLRGQILLHEASVKQAIRAFEKSEACFTTDGRILEQSRSQLCLAVACYLDKDTATARQKIKEVLGSESKNKQAFLIALRQVQTWKDGLLGDTVVGDTLQRLFEKANRIGKKLPGIRRRLRQLARTLDTPDAKLSVQTFGRTLVRVGGKVLTMSDWQTQSVRDLFFYFLMMPEPMTKEQVGNVFWPEIDDPTKLKIRFKNDLYRLRRVVGSNVILFEDDYYHFNRTLDYEYDVEAFENFLSQAKFVNDTGLKIELLEKAVNLVQGKFLEDVENTWVWTHRERLSQEFLSAVLKLADLLRNSNRINEAIAACQQAIDYDPTYETAYHKAMKIFGQLSDRTEIVRLYESYSEAMAHELDLPPSIEMETLYLQLIR